MNRVKMNSGKFYTIQTCRIRKGERVVFEA